MVLWVNYSLLKKSIMHLLKQYSRAAKIIQFNEYYYQIALCQSVLGDKSSAIKTLGIILENEEFPKCYFERGSYYGQLNKLDQALSDFNRGIELSPNFANLYMNKNVLCLVSKERI